MLARDAQEVGCWRSLRGALAANFIRGEKSREEITDLTAGGESLATLDADIEDHQHSSDSHPSSTVA